MNTDPVDSNEISGCAIAVGTKYHMIWDVDHAKAARDFLGTIDPTYFQYCSDAHGPLLKTEHRERAEIALRSNFSHAIECLFSMVGAAVQAPRCPAGWIMIATSQVLYSFVEEVSVHGVLPNAIGLGTLHWSAVVQALNPLSIDDDLLKEHNAAIKHLWSYLSAKFRDPAFREEYNSIKHGLRARSSPWILNMGLEASPGIPSTRMINVAKSPAGSTFLRKKRLKGDQWQLRDERSNWNPDDFIALMPLIVRSIANVRAVLLVQNGVEPKSMALSLFTTSEVDEALAGHRAARDAKVSFWIRIDDDDIPPLTQDDIRADYEDCNHGGR